MTSRTGCTAARAMAATNICLPILSTVSLYHCVTLLFMQSLSKKICRIFIKYSVEYLQRHFVEFRKYSIEFVIEYSIGFFIEYSKGFWQTFL